MRRRDFMTLGGGAALMGWAAGGPAEAGLRCTPVYPNGARQCQAGIESNIASLFARQQHASEWCWAACISMVFAYYGHPVAQERIVGETWGQIVNLPGQPGQILADLNRPWVDDRGRRFRAYGDVLSANVITASQDLAAGMPLIIGTRGHAMVLTALNYGGIVNNPASQQVLGATVRDPWPGNPSPRVLSGQEWFSTQFLVRIRVGA